MKVLYYKIDGLNVIAVNKKIQTKKWAEEVDWVSIKSNNRNEVVKLMEDILSIADVKGYIQHPHEFILPLISKEFVALNLSVSRNDEHFTPDYITIILIGPLVVTIFPEWLDTNIGKRYSRFMAPKVKDIKHHMFFSLAYLLLIQSVGHIMKARNQLCRLGNRLTVKPDEIRASEVIKVRSNIVQLFRYR